MRAVLNLLLESPYFYKADDENAFHRISLRSFGVLAAHSACASTAAVDAPEVAEGRKPDFLVHDKVIQTRNNYRLGVMNGASVSGGAEGVGRVTTRSVVQAITAIVVSDMIIGYLSTH